MSETPDDPATLAALVPDPPLEVPIAAEPPDHHGGAALASAVGAKLAASMFLHHFAVSVWFVTLGSYVGANSGANGLGMFAAGFVGMVYGAGPLGGMVSPFLTGLLADHWFPAERIMAVLNLICAAALWGAVSATTQWAFYLAVWAYFLCYYPSFSLGASMALHHLHNPARHFPVVRACGTAGWVAGGVLVGWLWPLATGVVIEEAATPMKIGIVAQLATAAFCLWLPHTPPANRRRAGEAAMRPSRAHLGDLWGTPRFRALMLLAVLAHISSQFYYAYGNVFCNWTGMSSAAAKMTLGQAVEVICMLLLPALLLRMSVTAAIATGLAVWAGRFLMLAAAALTGGVGRDLLLYAAILFHGVSFTLVTISLQLDVDRCAGRHRRATAQGLLSVAMQGFGCFAGAQLAGAAGARWLPLEVQNATAAGWQSFWLLPAMISAAVAGLTLVVLRPRIR